MGHIKGAALFLLALGAAPATANAATENDFIAGTTADLVNLCDTKLTDAMGSAALGFCYGFAQGAVSVEMEHDAGSRRLRPFCLPTPLPARAETMGAFVAWARASAERLALRPSDGLVSFLAERFPCGAGK